VLINYHAPPTLIFPWIQTDLLLRRAAPVKGVGTLWISRNMILEKLKTASVPALTELGKNETSSQTLVWRFTQRNGTRIRVSSQLGEFSVWQEGPQERQLFSINLGVLSEVCRRSRKTLFEMKMGLEKGCKLTPEQESKVWKRFANDQELRFVTSTKMKPAELGGWKKCIDKSAEMLKGLGYQVVWDQRSALYAKRM
jgi:hypothetical protein